MRPRALTAAFLLVSGAGDLAGGLWAALDWRGTAGWTARHLPGWAAQHDALGIAFADDALRQLWVNLGTALIAVGAAQLMAGRLVALGRAEGDRLAFVLAGALLLAGVLVTVCADQPTSLVTEGGRGVALAALLVWTRTAEARGPGDP